MLPLSKARQLRRQIAFLKAFIGEDGDLTPQSGFLEAWRSELEAQGYIADEVGDMFAVENKWLQGLAGSPADILKELTRELPEALQLEEEVRIEAARRAAREPSWGIPMALAWIRFRDVEQACRFLESRNALSSLWRDGLETDELQQRLGCGELHCTGVRIEDRHDISPDDWAREGRDGLRLMRASEPYAARPKENRHDFPFGLLGSAKRGARPLPRPPS